MKRTILLLLLGVLALAGCKKDEPLPTVQFGAALYTVYSHGSVQVAVLTEAPVEKDLVVPVYFGGAAVKETDYSVSADAVTIAAGADTGYLEITDIALSEEKQIVLTLEAPDGYDTGLRAKAVVSPVAEEALIYSFETPAADLLESYTATVERASKPLRIWRFRSWFMATGPGLSAPRPSASRPGRPADRPSSP